MPNLLLCVAAVAVFAFSCQCVMSAAPDIGDMKARLEKLPPAPRLLLGRGEETRVKELTATDPQMQALWDLIRRSADAMLTEPPVERKVVGRRLLGESRRALRRMTHLGMAYRLTGETKYVERGKAEMLAAAAFADWNPSHFLDVGEMTAALAIGVDWMHDALDDPTRATIRQAIIEKGLKPSLTNAHWAKGTNNWNQVCNGGMVLGTLVVAEDEPELAASMIARAIEGLPFALKAYAPDGAYPEGPGYWEYGTSFNVLLVAALEKALGSTFGLMESPGFERTAEYYLHVTGPTGLWFNYVDCGQRGWFRPSPPTFYLAAWQNDPGLLYSEREALARLAQKPDAIATSSSDRLLPMLLVWAKPGMAAATPKTLHYIGHGMTPVAVFRSAWDTQATFAGIKGGQATAPHGHMDVGTFVIDMLGTRFVEDLGMQDYHSIESIGMNLWDGKPTGDRWKIYRLNARSHNVLLIDDKDHDINGRGDIVASTPTSAKIDMAGTYAKQLAGATRELYLREDGSVTVTDDVKATESGGTVRWQIVTGASVAIQDNIATLTRDGKRVTLRITGTDGLALQARPADPPPGTWDAKNPGKTIVWFETRLQPGEARTWTAEFVPAAK